MLAQQAQVIRENARKQAELEAKMAGFEKRINAPPEPTPQEAAKHFFSNPAEVIRKEIRETVQPLIEFKETFQKQSQYDKVKADFKNDARYSEFLKQPGVEGTLDKLMADMPATPAAMYSVILGIRGGMEFGDIPKPGSPSGGPPTSGTRPADPMTPPHLRPTPPPFPEPEKKEDQTLKQRIANLDENERRLLREWNMTAEEYIAWIDTEAEKVASAKIGIPEKKEEKK